MRITACILAGVLLTAASCKKNEIPGKETVRSGDERALARAAAEAAIALPETYTSADYRIDEVTINQTDIPPILYDRVNTVKYTYDADHRLVLITNEYRGRRRTKPDAPLEDFLAVTEHRFTYTGTSPQVSRIEKWTRPQNTPALYLAEYNTLRYNTAGLPAGRTRVFFDAGGTRTYSSDEGFSYHPVAANYVNACWETVYGTSSSSTKRWTLDSGTGNFLEKLQTYPVDALSKDTVRMIYSPIKPGQPGDPEYLTEQLNSGLPIFRSLNLPVERQEKLSYSPTRYAYEFDQKGRVSLYDTRNSIGRLLKTTTIKYLNN